MNAYFLAISLFVLFAVSHAVPKLTSKDVTSTPKPTLLTLDGVNFRPDDSVVLDPGPEMKNIRDHYVAYKLYKQQYNEMNANTDLEYHRFATFAKNVEKIRKHSERYQRGEETFEIGINQFTDMLPEELRKRNGFRNEMRKKHGQENVVQLIVQKKLPKKVDWRENGAVTPVKDQGECGSCWAFSSTGSLEGQHFLKTGRLVSLSEQNLVDCSDDYGNMGCDGGLMDQAFDYIRDNGGLDTETSYPYEARDGTCRYSNRTRGANETGKIDLPEGDEKQLQAAVAQFGPVSVAIDASYLSSYSKGIYSNSGCSSEELNHGVLVVGYGSEDVKMKGGSKKRIDYWIIKNSWGEKWGENGYFRMVRNQNNMCGIATAASYPVV